MLSNQSISANTASFKTAFSQLPCVLFFHLHNAWYHTKLHMSNHSKPANELLSLNAYLKPVLPSTEDSYDVIDSSFRAFWYQILQPPSCSARSYGRETAALQSRLLQGPFPSELCRSTQSHSPDATIVRSNS